MAKGQDPFEKFKQATLSGSPSIKDAIRKEESNIKPSPTKTSTPPSPTPPSAPEAESPVAKKNENLEQVAFFVDKSLKRKVGLIKYETGKSFKELYEEALSDLIKKYNLH